jgi:bacteriochlorophyll 4-vinyl reductase
MEKSMRIKVGLLLALIAALEKVPVLVKLFLRPIANAPVISKKMKVLIRAYMGATAFDIHDVDLKNGRIGIGGVEEIMAGSIIIKLLHTILAEKMGEEKKNKTLYEIGINLCKWEVSQSLGQGRWAPKVLVPVIVNSRIIDEVQTDPLMARFFAKTMNMVSRLITDEGGWGHLDFDFSSMPLKVTLSNSQEARWLPGSRKPVCHFYAGIVAGYASAISGEELEVKEVACRSMGAPSCVFHVTRKSGGRRKG